MRLGPVVIHRIVKPYVEGLHLGSYTYLFSAILDNTLCKEDTKELITKHPELYIQSNVANFINLVGLSPIYYIGADNFLLVDKSTGLQILKLLGMLFTHNVMFYFLHKMFHDYRQLYFIHRFHHRFVKPIPSNGNAVSVTEYNIAYVLPFLFGAFMISPNGITFQISIAIISFLNSLVHSGALRHIRLPSIFVVPQDHLTHHEKLSTKYASPLLNVDHLIKSIKSRKESVYHKYRHTGSI